MRGVALSGVSLLSPARLVEALHCKVFIFFLEADKWHWNDSSFA